MLYRLLFLKLTGHNAKIMLANEQVDRKHVKLKRYAKLAWPTWPKWAFDLPTRRWRTWPNYGDNPRCSHVGQRCGKRAAALEWPSKHPEDNRQCVALQRIGRHIFASPNRLVRRRWSDDLRERSLVEGHWYISETIKLVESKFFRMEK